MDGIGSMSGAPTNSREDEQHDLLAAERVLAEHGLPSGPDGYNLSRLAAAIYAQGWGYSIDNLAGGYHAEILPLASSRLRARVHRIGASPEAALSLALAHALTLAGSTDQ